MEKETLSLPDIVDILGTRPYPVKESVMEYLQELRTRKETEDDVIADEEKLAQEKHAAAVENTKFDPDAEVPAEEENDDEKSASTTSDESKKDEEEEKKEDNESKEKDKKD